MMIQSMQGLVVHPNISHKLLHIHADPKTLRRTKIEWASPWVEQQVILRACERESFPVRSFIKSAGGIPEIANFRGNLYEPVCHNILMRGGRFRARNLSTRKEFWIEIPSRSGNLQLFKNLADISNNNSDDIMYWRPVSKNLAAVYAITQPNILVQITVAGKHKVVANGLLRALEILRDAQHARLYFVVPDDKFPNFQKQAIKGIKKHPEEVRERLKSVKQYALKIGL